MACLGYATLVHEGVGERNGIAGVYYRRICAADHSSVGQQCLHRHFRLSSYPYFIILRRLPDIGSVAIARVINVATQCLLQVLCTRLGRPATSFICYFPARPDTAHYTIEPHNFFELNFYRVQTVYRYAS